MARKWSELPSGTPQSGDQSSFFRGTINYRFTFDSLVSWLGQFFTTGQDLNDHAALPIHIPAGGSTNQVIVKSSATDYDVAWGNQSGGNGGGGISPGTPFVVGDLLAVESDTVDAETIETVGFSATAVARRDQANTFSIGEQVVTNDFRVGGVSNLDGVRLGYPVSTGRLTQDGTTVLLRGTTNGTASDRDVEVDGRELTIKGGSTNPLTIDATANSAQDIDLKATTAVNVSSGDLQVGGRPVTRLSEDHTPAGNLEIAVLTAAQYAALTPKDPDTLYFVTP